MFNGLDHFAIVVKDTTAALELWEGTFGFPVVCSEVVNGDTVRLTHLDLGNTHLQLVEPLTADHPLQNWLATNGEGIHHFCLKVDDVDDALVKAPVSPASDTPHQGVKGKRALFLNAAETQSIIVEVTGS